MTPHEIYTATASQIEDAQSGQMFGKPCYKLNGKAFVCFFQDCMVFKLSNESHTNALSQGGAQLFDPSGKGRAMKAWVQVPVTSSKNWLHYAKEAAKNIM